MNLQRLDRKLAAAALGFALAGCAGAPASTPAPADGGAKPASGPAAAFRATGNEPSWRLDIGPAETVLLTNFGQDRLVVATPQPTVADGTTRYVTRANGGEFAVTIVDRRCVDSMSGMPHPRTVSVETGGRTLNGCGGEPVSLLLGAEWRIVELGGAPVVAGSKPTLTFGPEGAVSGQSSCNRYAGRYSLTGEGLSISPGAGTRMMCGEPLMTQERRLLEALGTVQGFSIADDGALVLRTADGGTILARRP